MAPFLLTLSPVASFPHCHLLPLRSAQAREPTLTRQMGWNPHWIHQLVWFQRGDRRKGRPGRPLPAVRVRVFVIARLRLYVCALRRDKIRRVRMLVSHAGAQKTERAL